MNSVDGNSSVRRRTFSIRQIQSLIESPWLFRWQTLLPYSLVGVLLGYASEVFRLSQRSVVTGLAVSALSVSLTIVLIVGIGFALRRVTRNRVPIVFGSLIAVGVCRATIVTAVVDELSLNRESFLVSRIILSSGSVPIVLLVVAFIVSTFINAWSTRRETEESITLLKLERDNLLDEIARNDAVLLSESEKTIQPEISLVTGLNREGQKRGELADALDRLVSNVIRPLSHTLAARAQTVKTLTESVSVSAAPPPFPIAASFIGPVLAGSIYYLTSVVAMFDIIPLTSSIPGALLNALGLGFGLALFQLFLGNLRLSTRDVFIVVVLVHEGIGLLVAWTVLTFVVQSEQEAGLAITFALAAPVSGIIYVAQRLFTHYEAVRISQLNSTRREIALDVSEVRRRVWLRQRHVAHALHSSAQSRVHAVAQQIRNGRGAISATDVSAVSEVLDGVVSIVRSPTLTAPDAFVELSRAIEFWSGMCEITLVAGDGVRELSARNPEAAESLVVTCLEAINNAVRHGEATRIDVSINFAEEDVLKVVISSNGGLLESPVRGLGMTMFDDLTIEWTLSKEAPTTFTGYISARVLTEAEDNIRAF
jgi:hypothetical protein